METLTIDGTEYIKATKAAREFGYTSDYIGQLCRSGRVVAKLVGRSWYVALDSLHEHRTGRYKKTDTATERTVATQPSGNQATTYQVPIHGTVTQTKKTAPEASQTKADKESGDKTENQTFYRHLRTPLTIARYAPDETSLIPEVQPGVATSSHSKAAVIPIDLADANPVPVTAVDQEYTFKTPKRPKIEFSGSLAVEDAPEEQVVTLDTLERKNEPKITIRVATDTVRPSKPKMVTKRFPVSQSNSAASMLAEHKRSGTLSVRKVPAITEPASSGSRVPIFVAGSVVSALLITAAVLGFQSEVVASDTGVYEEISFTIEHLIASVYGSK